MKWEIQGTVIKTGQQGRWQVVAGTRGDAEDMAVANGVFAASIEPVVEDLASEEVAAGSHPGDVADGPAQANLAPAAHDPTAHGPVRPHASSSPRMAPPAGGGARWAALRTVAAAVVALCVGLAAGYFLGRAHGPPAADRSQGLSTAGGGGPDAVLGQGAQGGNLLNDSGKPGSWNITQIGTAQMTLAADKAGLVADVAAVDSTDWHAQITQDALSLDDGVRYVLRFRAKADLSRAIGVAVSAGPPDYHTLGLQRQVALGMDWKAFEFRFRTAKPQQGTNRLGFLLGQSKGKVYLSDISLSPAAGGNLLLPTAQAESWFLSVADPAKAMMAVADNALAINVTQPAAVDWYAQAIQSDLDVAEGKKYLVKFRAKADAPGTMGVYAAVSQGDFHSIGLAARAELGNDWKDYTYEFTTARTVPGLNRLSFAVGTFKGKVYLQDASLQFKGG